MSPGDVVLHGRQVDIGKIQAGVGVTADDYRFAPARHSAAQCVAAGFGCIVFHAFGVARCKIGHSKTAVVGFAVEAAVNFVMAVVAGGRGGDGGGDINAGEGRPLGRHSPCFNFPRFAHLAHEHVIVYHKGQHTVGSRLIEHLPAAGGAEAEAGIVGKFCVLFRELSVAVPLADTGGVGRYPARPALHQPRIAKDHGPYERMVLWLDKRYLEQLSTPQTSLTRCFDASAPGHTNLLRLPPAQRAESQTLMERLAAESEGAQAAAYGSDVVARACLLQLLAGLNRFALAAPARHEVEDKAGPVVAEVLHYINEHYPDELSLDLLSAKFFISKYHLSHEFHRLVGTSVYRYIIQKRLVIAKQMLANGVAPTDVYGHCGFGDYANFYRAFKAEYHISPKQFLGRAGNENTFGG